MMTDSHSTKRKWITIACLLFAALGVAILPGSGVAAPQTQPITAGEAGLDIRLIGDTAYKVSLDDFSQAMPQKPFIRLHNATFDPLNETIRTGVAPSLAAEVSDVTETLYIVQFYTQAFESLQKRLAGLGAVVVEPLPDHALIVKMSGALAREIERLSFVRWVGPYHPAYKMDIDAVSAAAIQPDTARCYSIWLSDADEQADVADFINYIQGAVPSIGDSRRMEISLTEEQILKVAQRPEVLSIDLCTEVSDDLDGVRESSGVNYIETVEGYRGEGVGAEVLDGGFRISHLAFKDNPLIVHSPSHYPSDAGHGTPCAGIVFGSGASNARAKGLLPNAARPIVASRQSLWGGTPTLAKRKSHTKELVDPSGPYRAVLQTSSWGNTQTTKYTSVSAEMDEIIFDLDIVLLQSQSNEGTKNSRPQAWAKNIVSVGGIKSGDTLKRTDDRWGGSLAGITSSASIGPANDGRIKPDLSHFYGLIFTAADGSNTAHTEFGGTSGATPATAGLFGLMHQMWADGILDGGPGKKRDVFDSRPHASTAKALMIHSAYQYPFSGVKHDLTRVHQGWGMADVKLLYDMAKDHNWRFPVLIDESKVIAPTEVHSYSLNSDGSKPFRATLVFADPPGNPSAAVQRINDLTLKVTSPDGTVYWGNNGLLEGNWSVAGGQANTIDTVENVFVQTPSKGSWTVEVIASEVVKDSHLETPAIDADYALVVSGGTSGQTPGKKFTLSTSIDGKGSISLSPKGESYAEGTVVTLTATPEAGFSFAGWSGDLSGSKNPASLTMNANKKVTALFQSSGTNLTSIAFDGMGSAKFSGGKGWLGNWTTSGSMVILRKTPYEGNSYLKIMGGPTPGRIERSVNLSTVTEARLKFANRIKSFEADDKAYVKVSSDGVNYTTVAEFTSAQGDDTWRLQEIDLSRIKLSADFRIVFESKMTSKKKDMWFLDSIEVVGKK